MLSKYYYLKIPPGIFKNSSNPLLENNSPGQKKLIVKNSNSGFSLIEVSIVMVIVGLILTAGMAAFKATKKATEWTSNKKNISTVKSSLIAHAVSRGRLPCPDTDGDGTEDPPCNAIALPQDLPHVTLNTIEDDSWHREFLYDPLTALTATTLNVNTFCAVLYEAINSTGTAGSTILPCVTNDAGDDGQIAVPPAQGYTVAAVILSDGDQLGLTGKNSNTNGEYEMANNPYDETTRNDMIGELTLNELLDRVCNQNIKITVQGATNADDPDDIAAYYQINNGVCTPLTETENAPGNTAFVLLGQTINLFADDDIDCNPANPGPVNYASPAFSLFNGAPLSAGCASPANDLMDCDISTSANGIVQIDGNGNDAAPTLADI
jgi:prepilin-type N-terminal cleavage/methylation domain-containing protein